MKRLFLVAAASVALLVPPLQGQGRGSGMHGGQGGMGGMQGGQRQPGGMGGAQRGQGQGQGAGTQTRDQQRLRIHATQQQRDQNRTCTQSMERVRTRLRDMSRLSKGKNLDPAQVRQMNEQLRNELQTMGQERERLAASLDQEQRTAAQDRLQQMSRDQQQLETFSEALEFELNQETVNAAKVREQVKQMNSNATRLQQQQRNLGDDLDFD